MSLNFQKPFKIIGQVKHDKWGRLGQNSIIPGFIKLSNKESDNQRFSELWFGAHPSKPSVIDNRSNVNLNDLIVQHPIELLGYSVVDSFGTELPFLFKILSIDKPLSIQIHPDRETAKELNAQCPERYPDANHKPEMAVAISEASLLYGFRAIDEVRSFLSSVPEFQLLLGDVQSLLSLSDTEFLQKTYSAIMRADKQKVKIASQELFIRLSSKTNLSKEEKLLFKLADDYPDGDVGLFCFYILNLIVLQPREAIFIASGVLHAYLSGELIECMANSDNVIRGGLTEKFVDVETLLALSNYSAKFPCKLSLVKVTNDLSTYDTDCKEFSLSVFDLVPYVHRCLTNNRLQMLFSLNAEGKICASNEELLINSGDVIIIPASVNEWELSCNDGLVFLIQIPYTY